MRCAVVATWGGGALLQSIDDRGLPVGPVERARDLVSAVRERERAERPRWVWASTTEVYPGLLRAGVRVARCHDLVLGESLLLGHEGRWGEPRSVAAAWARLRGEPVPPDPAHGPRDIQPALFDADRSGMPEGVSPLETVLVVHAEQLRRVAATADPGKMRLLLAAESAAALAAAEMGHDGLPWRADVHDALLTELLGPRPHSGVLPERLRSLAEEISGAFGGRRVNPDAPAEVVRALAREGVQVPSARSWVLRRVDHPAVPLLLAYKELSRLHAAHGWAWLESWVRGGRFRPEYVVGGVVSGRWASRGGGALQIPRIVRRAVVADPGWVLVVADASQLEPRVLAALAGDRGMASAAARADLYEALGAEVFGGDRARAKVALLGTIYGQTSGEAGQLLASLRQRFPSAVEYVEAAARAGEEGRLVRSALGRTCPPPSRQWREVFSGAGHANGDTADEPDLPGGDHEDPDSGRRAVRAARDRGRFTRNFVVQASAADWALVLLATLRSRLAALPAEPPDTGALPADAADTEAPDTGARPLLVFFQHDEVVVHAPRAFADAVVNAIAEAGREAATAVFGATPVQFPLDVAVVECYADAK